MAKNPKNTPAAPSLDMALLKQVADATQANSFVYTSVAQHKPLLDAGYVEVNTGMADGNGNVATRATATGIDAAAKSVAGASPAPAGAATEAAKPAASRPSPSNFELDDAVAMPTIKRGGPGGNVYPFDTMNAGQSFFVAATDDRPNPAKSLASTVSSATKRYADQTPVRKFAVRSVVENGAKGARVWRTE